MVRSLASSTIPVSTGMCILHEEQHLFDAIKLREACSTYSVLFMYCYSTLPVTRPRMGVSSARGPCLTHI